MQKSIPANNRKKVNLTVNKLQITQIINKTVMVLVFLGFLLSKAIIIDSIAPLGVAFYLYISRVKKYNIPVFFATLAGTMMSSNSITHISKYIICIVFIMLFSRYIRKINSILVVSLLGFILMGSISVGQAIVVGVFMSDIIRSLFESSLLFVSVYIYSYGIPLLIKRETREAISNEEIVALSIIMTFSILGIGNIHILDISIQNILAVVLIIIMAYCGGSTLGASTGLIIGLIYSISNDTSIMNVGIYAIAGLIAGIFSNMNKYICTLGYVAGWAFMTVYATQNNIELNMIKEVALGCICIFLIKDKMLTYIKKFTTENVDLYERGKHYINRSREITNSRLINMYKTYEELANTFDKIREKDKVIDQRDIASIIDRIHNDECKQCGMRRRCWDMKFNYTYTMISNVLNSLEEDGRIVEENVSNEFTKTCINPESIVKAANYYYRLFALDYNWNQKLSETRQLVSRQIKCIASSIEGLANDLNEGLVFDLDMERKILIELDKNNVSINNIQFIKKNDNDFEITINKNTCRDYKLCDKKIEHIISDVVGSKVSAQKIGCNSLSNDCKIILTKAQNYKAITKVSSMSKDGHIFCGDNYTYMEIEDGKYMAAISDGMGKGEKAYEESSVTIDILEKMMECRISEEITIDTINNMLILKSSDEMFSTLDLSLIDLKTGKLEIVKMGACSTYIKREDKQIDIIDSSSLPIGILSDVNICREVSKVRDGDYIIMVSDGIIDAGKNNNLGDNWLLKFIKNVETTNPKEISKMILNKALDIQSGKIEDDMTVVVTKIYKN